MTAFAAGPLGMSAPDYRRFDLPWTRMEDEARRFRNALLGVMGVLLVLSVIIPFLPATKVRQHVAQDIPPRLARFVLERKIVPPPPPPPPPVAIQPEAVAEPVPVVVEKPRVQQPRIAQTQTQTQPQPQPQPQPKRPAVDKPVPVPTPTIEQARNRAKSVGLLAAADDLASLRLNSAVAQTKGQSLSAAVGNGNKTERALLTSRSGKRSAGVNTANLSRNTGGGGLASRATTTVTSPVAPAKTNRTAGAGTNAVNDYAGQRSQEEIETIFDQNKAAIYALYRRALRQDPSLQGKLVLQLTIAASGQVVSCSIVSSELNAPEFEQNLVKRVSMFDFGPQEVDEVTTTKPIDFFPA